MSDATRTLEEQVAADLAAGMTRETAAGLLSRARDPRFGEARAVVHDWRDHVPEPVRAQWWDFGDAIRVAIVAMACDRARKDDRG